MLSKPLKNVVFEMMWARITSELNYSVKHDPGMFYLGLTIAELGE